VEHVAENTLLLARRIDATGFTSDVSP